MIMRLLTKLAITTALLATTVPAHAQSAPHGIAAVVNSDIVTIHDLRQRVLFMMATTGAERDEATIQRLQRQALSNLINEHLQMQESEKYEQTISDEQVNQRLSQLLSRNGADPNKLVADLAAGGVSIETLRDQIRSEIAWQRIVNGLYGSRIRISDAQIDETLNQITANASKPNYRIAEIYIEASPEIGGIEGAMEGANAMIAQVKNGAPFQLLAQQFSSAASAARGGDVGWVREGEQRPEIDAAIKAMEVGSVSAPIQVPGGVYVIALIEKRVSESDTLYKLKQVTVEDETEAAKSRLTALRGDLQSCETLEADVKAIEGVEAADMGEIKSSDLTDEIVAALERTDIGGLSDPFDRPNGATSIMVCKRETTGTDIPTRDQIEDRLLDQQLAQASKRALRNLRREATLVVR